MADVAGWIVGAIIIVGGMVGALGMIGILVALFAPYGWFKGER